MYNFARAKRKYLMDGGRWWWRHSAYCVCHQESKRKKDAEAIGRENEKDRNGAAEARNYDVDRWERQRRTKSRERMVTVAEGVGAER